MIMIIKRNTPTTKPTTDTTMTCLQGFTAHTSFSETFEIRNVLNIMEEYLSDHGIRLRLYAVNKTV